MDEVRRGELRELLGSYGEAWDRPGPELLDAAEDAIVRWVEGREADLKAEWQRGQDVKLITAFLAGGRPLAKGAGDE